LGRLEIPYGGEPPRINGWKLLRGSHQPHVWTATKWRKYCTKKQKRPRARNQDRKHEPVARFTR
jgi:hypothetical protein